MSILTLIISGLIGLTLSLFGIKYNEILFWSIDLPLVFIVVMFNDNLKTLETNFINLFKSKKIDKEGIMSEWNNLINKF